MSTKEQALSDNIGQALSAYMGENASDGEFTVDPFDSNNIDAIADAVVAALPAVEAATGPSEQEIEALARGHGTGGWQSLNDMKRFARAVLALRSPPVAAPADGFKLVPDARQDIRIEDRGSPEYLDGVECQFNVVCGEPYPYSEVIAYVMKKDDAERIAAALSASQAHGKSEAVAYPKLQGLAACLRRFASTGYDADSRILRQWANEIDAVCAQRPAAPSAGAAQQPEGLREAEPALSDADFCHLQYVEQALAAIANRQQQVANVIERIDTITAASKRAKEALRRFQLVAPALARLEDASTTAPQPAPAHPDAALSSDEVEMLQRAPTPKDRHEQ